MTRLLPITTIVAVAALTVSCSGDDSRSVESRRSTASTLPARHPSTTVPGPTVPTADPHGPARFSALGSERLKFFAECPDLLTYMQQEASKRVTAWGLGGYGYPMMFEGRMSDDKSMSAVPSLAGGESVAPQPSGAPNYSGTNTQEAGVDEGDIVETDGNHVFVASPDGVRIVDVADAKVVAKLDVPEGNHQLLLDGTRLLVATQPYGGIDMVVSLYDVSNATSPTLLHRTHLEGYLVAARSVGGTARLVLTTSLATRLPFVHPDQFGLDEQRALQRNQDIISQSTVEDWMPRWFDVAADGSFGEMSDALDCAAVAAPSEFAGLGISWIASIDLDGTGQPVGSAGIVSGADTVYASATNIYLATMPWDWYQPMRDVPPNPEQPPTLIHQFALGADGTATYVASGEVPGRLLNQFSMSEYNGDLRVATTTFTPDGVQGSSGSVRVLRPNGKDLDQIGVVDGLGDNEQIYAVRFLGAQAYVVTFRQTDPLFVVDLSDPTSPAMTGELKINGYSAYLHPVGDGLLLGIGQDATDDGRVQGTQLSLFDVHDPANPQRLSTLTIGGYSEAEWDHHAFLYWPEDGTIVLPVSPGWSSCPIDVQCLAGAMDNPQGGVVVAQLQGTTLVGRGVISQRDVSTNGCWNPLVRSVVIGDELATVGADHVQFTDLTTLVNRDSANWASPDQYGCLYMD